MEQPETKSKIYLLGLGTKPSRIKESEGRHIPSRQCAASRVFDNLTKVFGTQLGRFTPSTIHCKIPFNGKKFNFFGRNEKSFRKLFCR